MTTDVQELTAQLKREHDCDLSTAEGRFPAACALYWYCSDWHGGQSSVEYSIMSAQLGYHPGANESGVEPESPDADIYADLEAHRIDPQTLCDAITVGADGDTSDD